VPGILRDQTIVLYSGRVTGSRPILVGLGEIAPRKGSSFDKVTDMCSLGCSTPFDDVCGCFARERKTWEVRMRRGFYIHVFDRRNRHSLAHKEKRLCVVMKGRQHRIGRAITALRRLLHVT